MPVDKLLTAFVDWQRTIVRLTSHAQAGDNRTGVRVFTVPDEYAGRAPVRAFVGRLMEAKRGGSSILAGGTDRHTRPGCVRYWFGARYCRVRFVGGPFNGRFGWPLTHPQAQAERVLMFDSGGHWGYVYRRYDFAFAYEGKTRALTFKEYDAQPKNY